jgi:glycerol-3-phosphate dehydrogenase
VRLVTIYGGKLTGYRATAARVMRRLRRSLPARAVVADTAMLSLSP